MAKYKVPSQAASGADTFSDNLVGNQITTGTGQLTNSNFALDSQVIQRDVKTFKTNPFSDFLTLEDLKKQTSGTTTNDTTTTRDKNIKFKGAKNDTSKSLFGSLKSRLGVATTKIINNFPAAILVDSNSLIKVTTYTAYGITYNSLSDTTQFNVEYSRLYNPFSVVMVTPKSSTITPSINVNRDFYSSFKNYVISISGETYDVISYTEPNSDNVLSLKVSGKPFTGTTYSSDFLIRPNNKTTEEFFESLDDLEESLLNRDTSPKYTSTFKVPRDSFDQSKTELITVSYSWPLSDKEDWNIKITGLEYDDYLRNLSDIADEIDDYKSNLFVRFLTSPQLFEFDSPDQKAEAIFQLYGQSFDKVKKYIDNIAYMRNVSYDGINNVPDVLLKNLANTLGLDTINLVDEKSLDDLLYSKTTQQYSGLTSGTSLIDAEYEFYRRLLVNLAYIYKSKGTRQSLEFFLRFLGAPEPMIKIDQYLYKVTSLPKSFDLNSDIYDVISGNKIYKTAIFLPTGGTIDGVTYPSYSYYTGITTGTTTFTIDNYPVDPDTFLPKGITGSTEYFFQKGSGWYDNTAQHKSPLIIDTDNSVLTGRTKNVVTKNSPYTYGEDYFNIYRNLPGLDTGYKLRSYVDNNQTEVLNDNSGLILNRKNIEVYLSSAQAVDYDIYRKSRDLELTFGTNSLLPQTGVTFVEYVNKMLHEQIKNSNLIRYKKNYITLEDIYQDYITHTDFIPYTISDLNLFIQKMSPYWTSVIDQIIPSTTLWTGGNLISNNIFGRSKYQYRYGCQPVEIFDFVYPEITGETTNYFEEEILWMDEQVGFTTEIDEGVGELEHDGYIKFFPTFEIDGVVYSGSSNNSSTYVLVSGDTTIHDTSARLYTYTADQIATGQTINNTLDPDYTEIMYLWRKAITGTTAYINTYSGATIDSKGKNTEYGTSIGNSSITGTTKQPLFSLEFYIDNEGYERIKMTSYKYGPHDCTVDDYLIFGITAIGDNDRIDCRFSSGTGSYTFYTGCTFSGGTGTFQLAPPSTSTPIPTSTPTPTNTLTPTATPLPATATPIPTATTTPLPATATPTATATPSPLPATNTPTPTSTNTPTPTPTVVCVNCSSSTVTSGTTNTGFLLQTHCLDLSSASNGATIYIAYQAYSRLNRFYVFEDGLTTVSGTNTGWIGTDNTYPSPPYNSPGLPTGTISFTYNSSKTYELKVEIAPENPSNPENDSYEFTLTCGGSPSTPTPTNTNTPTPTPTPLVYQLGYHATQPYTACLNATSAYSTYRSSGLTLTNGVVLLKPDGVTPVDQGYYSDGTNHWRVLDTSGTLYAESLCTTPTPTPSPTPIYQGIGIYTGATYGNSNTACTTSTSPNGTVYISNGDTLSNGDILYTNVTLTTAFNGNDQYYRIFITPTWYAAQISSGGFVSNLTNCTGVATYTPTPTPTNTPTPSPTPFQTTFNGFVSLVDEATACNGGDYGLVSITVNGTSICDATAIVALNSGVYGNIFNDMLSDDTFYVNRLSNSRTYQRIGLTSFGTPVNSCSSCPTPTPTPTNTNTPSPATATPTPTNTNTPLPATATPTPTNTLTPSATPTPIYQGIAIYTGSTFGSGYSACLNGSSPNGTVYIGNGDTLSDGDRLYTNITLTTNFNGNDQYYRLFYSSTWYTATISSGGYVSNLVLCSSVIAPTNVPTTPPTLPPTNEPTAIPATNTPTPEPTYYYYRFIQCPDYGGAVYQYYAPFVIADGTIVQTSTSCFTVSTFKPGSGADGLVPSFDEIVGCEGCLI